MKGKAVVIISGGMDSTVLAHYIQNLGYDLSLLSFDYGQRHRKELIFATLTAVRLHVSQQTVDLQNITSLLGGSSLTSNNIDVPEGHYSQENMALTVVPNRNAIMLSIAYGHAVAIGATEVCIGVHAGDHAVYPDCRAPFILMLDKTLGVGNEGFASPNLHIYTPFITQTKTDIARIGSSLGVPFELTWSCYKGGEKHCGKCGTCVERLEALHDAGVEDKTEYEDNTYWKEAVAGFKSKPTE